MTLLRRLSRNIQWLSRVSSVHDHSISNNKDLHAQRNAFLVNLLSHFGSCSTIMTRAGILVIFARLLYRDSHAHGYESSHKIDSNQTCNTLHGMV